VNYWLHPEAAEEHKHQVAYYEEAQAGLGKRYHDDFLDALSPTCATPTQSRIALAPNIRRTMLKVLRYTFVRQGTGNAFHHRKIYPHFVAASPDCIEHYKKLLGP
jgi:hypothetical protein